MTPSSLESDRRGFLKTGLAVFGSVLLSSNGPDLQLASVTQGYKIVWKNTNGEYFINGSKAGSGEPSSVIQATIDRLAKGSGGTVYVAGGEHFLEHPITVRNGVELSTGPSATLFNWSKGKPTRPIIHFKRKSGTSRLFVDAQDQGGVVFGEDGLNSHNFGNIVGVVNAGSEQAAIELRGYYHRYNHLNALGGSEGIWLNGASDVFVNSALSVGSVIGVRIDGTHAAHLSNVDCDSPQITGLQIDSSHDVNVDGSVWFNQSIHHQDNAWIAVNLGRWSESTPNVQCNIGMNINRTGGKAVYLGHNQACALDFNVTNRSIRGVNSPALTKGIEVTEHTVESILSGLITNDVPDRVSGTEAQSLKRAIHLP